MFLSTKGIHVPSVTACSFSFYRQFICPLYRQSLRGRIFLYRQLYIYILGIKNILTYFVQFNRTILQNLELDVSCTIVEFHLKFCSEIIINSESISFVDNEDFSAGNPFRFVLHLLANRGLLIRNVTTFISNFLASARMNRQLLYKDRLQQVFPWSGATQEKEDGLFKSTNKPGSYGSFHRQLLIFKST